MHEILFSPSATRDYKKIPWNEIIKINRSIDNLAENPRPVGCRKLTGRDAYRIRIGNYRVIYEINDNKLIVLIIRIRDRKEVYQK